MSKQILLGTTVILIGCGVGFWMPVSVEAKEWPLLNQTVGSSNMQTQSWNTSLQWAKLVNGQGTPTAIVLQLGILSKPVTTQANVTYQLYILRGSEKIALYDVPSSQLIQNASGAVVLPPTLIPVQLLQARLGQEVNLADQSLQAEVQVRYDLPNGEQNLGLSLDRTQRYSAIATTPIPQLVGITVQPTTRITSPNQPAPSRLPTGNPSRTNSPADPTLSPNPPEQPPVALVNLNNGFVTVNLINKTGAVIDYQVLEDTDVRQLAGRSSVTLKNLQTPITLNFRRSDGGLLIPKFNSQPGQLEIQLEATTNFNLDRTVVEIDDKGQVFSN